MPHCIDYCISKISVRAVECVYTARPLRSSSDPNILSVAATRTKSYGQRAFAYLGPINWNRVPGGIRIIEEKETFTITFKDSTVQQARFIRISILSHYLLILLFIITSCVHFCSVLFPCHCLAFWILCYYNLY